MSDRIRYFPSTSDRVSMHTSSAVNDRILHEMEASIAKRIGNRHAINVRIGELSYEWDIERGLELLAGGMSLAGALLGRLVHPRWYFISAMSGACLAMHALQGWCPSMVVLRRLGFRTPREIESERIALKALRGDFTGCELEGVTPRNLLKAADPSFYRHRGSFAGFEPTSPASV